MKENPSGVILNLFEGFALILILGYLLKLLGFALICCEGHLLSSGYLSLLQVSALI
jgi:hypothetical protein